MKVGNYFQVLLRRGGCVDEPLRPCDIFVVALRWGLLFFVKVIYINKGKKKKKTFSHLRQQKRASSKSDCQIFSAWIKVKKNTGAPKELFIGEPHSMYRSTDSENRE